MKLLSTNSKLKKDRILCFGLPAKKTCPFAGECKRYCYAGKGMYVFPCVKASRERNFAESKKHTFAGRISAELLRKKKLPRAIRIHDSGDFYSVDYRAEWLGITRSWPEIHFYAYTKSLPYFVDLKTGQEFPRPQNFRVIYSLGGKYDAEILRLGLRHAKIFESKAAMADEDYECGGYEDGSESDLVAAFGTKNVGLLWH